MRNKNKGALYRDLKFIFKDILRFYLGRGLIIFILGTIGIFSTLFVITQVISFITSLLTKKPYTLLSYSTNINDYSVIVFFACAVFILLICGFFLDYISKHLMAAVACDYEKRCRNNLVSIVTNSAEKLLKQANYETREVTTLFTKSLRSCNRSMYEMLAAIAPIFTILILSMYLAFSYPILFVITTFIIIIGLFSYKNIGTSAKVISRKLEYHTKNDLNSKKMFVKNQLSGIQEEVNLEKHCSKWDKYLKIYQTRLTIAYKGMLLGNVFYTIGLSVIIIVVCSEMLYHHTGNYHAIYYVLVAQYMFLQIRNIGKTLTKIKLFSSQAFLYSDFVNKAKKLDFQE